MANKVQRSLPSLPLFDRLTTTMTALRWPTKSREPFHLSLSIICAVGPDLTPHWRTYDGQQADLPPQWRPYDGPQSPEKPSIPPSLWSARWGPSCSWRAPIPRRLHLGTNSTLTRALCRHTENEMITLTSWLQGQINSLTMDSLNLFWHWKFYSIILVF